MSNEREIRVFVAADGRVAAVMLDPSDMDNEQAAADLEQAATILRGGSVTVGNQRMTSTTEAVIPAIRMPSWVIDHRFTSNGVLDRCAHELPPLDDSDFRLCGLPERDHHLRAD